MDDLIDEIGRRCNHAIVVTDIDERGNGGFALRKVEYRGGYSGAMGLAMFAKAWMEAKLITGTAPDNEEG